MSRKTEPRGIPITFKGSCPDCGGTGTKGMYQDHCLTCGGSGKTFEELEPCKWCDTKHFPNKRCAETIK